MQQAAVGTVFAALSPTTALLLTSCTEVTSDAITTRSSAPATMTTSTSPTSAQPAAFTPVVGSVVAEPVPVLATDGKTHLAYELELELDYIQSQPDGRRVTGDPTKLTSYRK